MNADTRQKIFAMARHEFSDHSVEWLKSEYKRKLLLKEFHIFGQTLTSGEMLVLFETLIRGKIDARSNPD